MIDARLALRLAAIGVLGVCIWLMVGELEARGRRRAAGERWRLAEISRINELAGELSARAARLTP